MAASFTAETAIPLLGGLLLAAGYTGPDLRLAGYNQLAQTCLAPEGSFDGHIPQIFVLLFRLEDLADSADKASEAYDTISAAMSRLRQTVESEIVISLPPRPRQPAGRVTEFPRGNDWLGLWHRVSSDLLAFAGNHASVYLLDLEQIIGALGEASALSPQGEYLYRQPFTGTMQLHMSRALARIIDARMKPARKCIVIDCDNTLWGGIIGEDGIGGVELGPDFPGRAYVEFQSQLKALRMAGTLLAISSKNNPQDVLEMFDSHPAMVLRRDDISVFQVNWEAKSRAIENIAAELNIGIDSLVFVDDSSFEIEEVRVRFPEVACLQVPNDVEQLPDLLVDNGFLFDKLTITSEDRTRTEMMRSDRQRRDQGKTLTAEEFLRTVELRVDFNPYRDEDLARFVQLINKSNQFNLTTRRYSADDIRAMRSDRQTDLFSVTVGDKFGDYGLVGICILKAEGKVARVDSLLMSCRVLGRGVETAMLAQAVALARARGCDAIVGEYRPTKKNAMVSDLYPQHGFVPADEDGLFIRNTESLPSPEHLAVTLPATGFMQ
ncbi:HAD-IIIC family phosphatase [Devosia sp. Root635]|uniref:HAD-IIIC family phosphatase n=1 Tax=Devosia sp. Root635 TaxID=1736575 RepID=UPI000B31ACC2|nr:HAD-IIIC family phosphatase [Devosia sp. Root635]